jgi:hypothetical protein
LGVQRVRPGEADGRGDGRDRGAEWRDHCDVLPDVLPGLLPRISRPKGKSIARVAAPPRRQAGTEDGKEGKDLDIGSPTRSCIPSLADPSKPKPLLTMADHPWSFRAPFASHPSRLWPTWASLSADLG